MITQHWTPEAERKREAWLAERLTITELQGADPEEVAEGLRTHVEEELRRRNVTEVTEEALLPVLNSMGTKSAHQKPSIAPKKIEESAPKNPRTNKVEPSPTGFKWPMMFSFFAFILPLLTIIAEWSAGLCASTFFDPIPTGWHTLALLIVPLTGFLVSRISRGKWMAHTPWASLGTGISLSLCLYLVLSIGVIQLWAVLLLPVSIIYLLVYLVGLLAWMLLSPFFALWAHWRGFRLLVRDHRTAGKWVKIGSIVGVMIIAALDGPRYVTLLNIEAATSDHLEERVAALNRIRRFGSFDAVHSACYVGTAESGAGLDLPAWVLSGRFATNPSFGKPAVKAELARTAYFRLTGKAFNEVTPRERWFDFAGISGGSVRSTSRKSWAWDGERGGDAVGARLAGLSMASSRLDWHYEKETRLAYGEWTMEFLNEHSNPQEARCQIQLPTEACVSRLTLWVNDQPQEAAYAPTAQVKAAYKTIVTVERRDPVLVTQIGPDRIMMQCFPVPANGAKKMKVRIGLTAPVAPGTSLKMPLILERNFSLTAGMKHQIWAQSRTTMEIDPKQSGIAEGPGKIWSWQGSATSSEFKKLAFSWPEPPSATAIWCLDPFASNEEDKHITGVWAKREQDTASSVQVVIDGSITLAPHREAIQCAVRHLSSVVPTRIWLASDQDCQELALPSLEAQLTFIGGQDCGPALSKALSAARSDGKRPLVVWLHGQQSAEISKATALEQLLTYAPKKVPIISIQLESGPHRLLEKLYRQLSFQSGPRLCDVPNELMPTMERLVSNHPVYRLKIETKETALTAESKASSDQLARWAAYKKALEAFHRETTSQDESAAAQAAAKHQIVSPFSGAVVLETAKDYAANNLEQSSTSAAPSVPIIPEPGAVLFIASSAVLLLRRKRRSTC